MTPSPQLLDAVRHHQTGQLDAADRLYRAAIAANPKDMHALHLRGALAHQTGRNEDAVHLIGRAIALDERVPDFHYNIGLALWALGRRDEATRHWSRVLDLSPERVGTFDVVLVLGVLYHLPNPLLALERVASVARDLLILETVVDMVGVSRPAVAFYPGRQLNDDPTNWWGPNVPAVHGMLRASGFGRVETITRLPSLPYRAARAVVHAARGQNTLAGALRQDRAVFHAWKAAPVKGPL